MTRTFASFTAEINSLSAAHIACPKDGRKMSPMHVTLKAGAMRSQDEDCKHMYYIVFAVLYTQSAVGRQLGGLSNLIASAQNGEAPRLFASLALLIAASPLS